MKLAPKKVYFVLTERNPKEIADESRASWYPPVSTVPCQSYAFDDNGSLVEIRYAVGESSINPDKQSNRVTENSLKDIIISDGSISVKETEKALLEYLRSSVYNEANNYPSSGFKTKFKEVSQSEEADKLISSAKRAAEAEKVFFELSENQHRMKGVLRKLGVTGKEYPVKMMKGLTYVKKNPDEFIKLMANSQEVALAERIESIYVAEQTNIITYQLGKWSWEGAGEIIPVVKGENPHSYLAEWTFESKEGQGVWKRLNEVMNANSGKDTKTVSELPISKTHEVILEGLTAADLLDKGKKMKAIVYEGKQFKYTDLDGDVHAMGTKKDEAHDFINKTVKIKDELKRRIAATLED